MANMQSQGIVLATLGGLAEGVSSRALLANVAAARFQRTVPLDIENRDFKRRVYHDVYTISFGKGR